jgi:hypothetical protein
LSKNTSIFQQLNSINVKKVLDRRCSCFLCAYVQVTYHIQNNLFFIL